LRKGVGVVFERHTIGKDRSMCRQINCTYLLAFADNSHSDIATIVNEVCLEIVIDDGLISDTASINPTRIKKTLTKKV